MPRRKKAPATLDDKSLNAFFTAAPAALAVFNREMRIIKANETAAQMVGLPLDQLLERHLRDFAPGMAPFLEPMFERILSTGQPMLNEAVSGETAAQPGAVRHWVASFFPLPGPGGRPAGVGVIAVDETARRRAEEARRRSGAEFRAIVQQATWGIYRSSADGRFVRANPALVRMLGYTSEAQVLALDLARDVYVDAAERDQLIRRYEAAETIRGVEVRWRRQDGHEIIVRLSGRPQQNDAGALRGFSMLAEDVTEQRTLERALQQAQKMQTVGRLASGIAHDFNNLLTVILSHGRLAADSLPAEDSELREDLERILGAARRGADLVRKLLAYSRHEQLKLQTLDLVAWTRGALELLRRVLPSSIEIGMEADDHPGPVEVDAGALEQILMNLVTNARDAMAERGTLHVEVRRVRLDEDDRRLHSWVAQGSFVCLAVSDTGTGMDEQTLARIFDPFFTTKPPGVGTGLGLAMVYGLVKQHKGFVHFYSEVGQGTTAKVYLPLAPHDAAAAPAAALEEAPPGGTEGILLIEDEPRLRVVAERLLQKFGYGVLAAPNGEEGLALFGARRPDIDLVLTDLVMPKMGGMELYERLRRDGDRVKVLFMSGYPEQRFRERAGNDAGVRFLTKPWTAGELLRHVRDLLDKT
jgi:two-component system cell cycle sensor histidine kinase/response regulator CckA